MKHSLSILILFCLCLGYRLTAQKVPNDLPSFQQLLIQLEQIRADRTQKAYQIIPRLESISEKAQFPYRNLLQSLLADEYARYYWSRLQVLRESPPRDINSRDFRRWNAAMLSDKITQLYLNSLSEDSLLRQIPTSHYLRILSSSGLAVQYQTSLYEVLVYHALHFLTDPRSELHRHDQIFRIRSREAFVVADSFINLEFGAIDTFSTAYLATKLYQQLLQKQQDYDSPFPFVYSNIQRLKYGRRRSSGQLQLQRYAQALQDMLAAYSDAPYLAQGMYRVEVPIY